MKKTKNVRSYAVALARLLTRYEKYFIPVAIGSLITFIFAGCLLHFYDTGTIVLVLNALFYGGIMVDLICLVAAMAYWPLGAYLRRTKPKRKTRKRADRGGGASLDMRRR